MKDACERSNLWKQYVKIYFYVLMFLVGLGSLYFVNTIFLPPNPLSVNQLNYYALGNFLHGLWIAFCFFGLVRITQEVYMNCIMGNKKNGKKNRVGGQK